MSAEKRGVWVVLYGERWESKICSMHWEYPAAEGKLREETAKSSEDGGYVFTRQDQTLTWLNGVGGVLSIEFRMVESDLTVRIFMDGDMWCALAGQNIQEGTVGFGPSPALAVAEFLKVLDAEDSE